MSKAGVELFSQRLLDIYRASAECPLHEFQDAALNAVKPAVAFDASMWGTAQWLPSGIDIHSIHLHQKSPQMLIDYQEVKHLDSAAASMAGKPHHTRAFHAPTVNGAPHEAALLDMLLKHRQVNTFITAHTDEATGLVQWITLFRGDPEQQGHADETSLVAQFAPHLMLALDQSRARHLDRLRIVDGTTREALIADAHGVVYHATPGYEALLRAEWRDWRRGALPAALHTAVAGGTMQFTGHALVADARIERDLLFVRLRARCAADALSPREREVAQLMARGWSHNEVAREVRRAPATVRNQLQSAYRKLDVQSIGAMGEALRKL